MLLNSARFMHKSRVTLRFTIMRFLLCILPFAITYSAWCQTPIAVAPTAHDFGRVDRNTDRVVDFEFVNNDTKTAHVLTTTAMPEYATRWSARSAEPGERIVLRVKFNPQKKMKYNDAITVYFTNTMTPIVFELTADVQFIDRSDNPACPDFDNRPANCCPDDAFTVEVVDRSTQLPIARARVRLYEQGRKQRDVTTDRNGTYSEVIPIGYYLTHVSAEGYHPADSTGYLNRRNNYLRFELDALQVLDHPAAAESNEPTIEDMAADLPITIHSGGVPEPPVPAFKTNNLLFLVDVSQSMFYKSRLELLKAGMLEMLDGLREGDHVALVSYAETTDEVMGMTPVGDKVNIARAIGGLVAGGRTMGAKGFHRAYGLLGRHAQKTANNQLIVVTDGAFRTIDANRIIELAEAHADLGIVTTIVGVRCSDSGRVKLSEIAAACGGSFIEINDIDQASERLEVEINERSRIR